MDRVTQCVLHGSPPGVTPQFGIVELPDDGGQHPGTVSAVTGDPIAMPVQLTGERFELEAVRLLAPVIPRSKVVAVGPQLRRARRRAGQRGPRVPLVFFKPNTSVIGPGEPILYPSTTQELAYEGELALVIGRICRDVPAERVPEVIFGYTAANDVTARDLQKSDGQWARAKGYDTFCPLGPWITTHQSVDEMCDVLITTSVDGEERQHGSTKLMVRGIVELVVFISSFTTLLPGDVDLDRHAGRASGRCCPARRCSVTIEGIGTLTNPDQSVTREH